MAHGDVLGDGKPQLAACHGQAAHGPRELQLAGADAEETLSALDTDGRGKLSESEFAASRPSPAGGDAQGAGAQMPLPPAAAAGGGASGSASSSHDPLDTNEDGVVSAADPLQALFDNIDTNGDNTIGSDEAQAFAQKLTDALQAGSGDATASTAQQGEQGTAPSPLDIGISRLAELARREYDHMAQGAAQQAQGLAISALA
ncbi:hypothetical protein PY257_00080 [Ramlibacter sp. H39-3-26]|nr:hypothetical protein [Ramlibacter sp. H39-3-26]